MTEDGTDKDDKGVLKTFNIEVIVNKYEGALLRYVYQLVWPDLEEAQDIVQECFLKLYQKLEANGIDSVQGYSAWLFRVAHNQAVDFGRRKKRETDYKNSKEQALEQTPFVAPDTVGELIRKAAGERALSELKKLPDVQRQILLLKIIQDLSFREIAKITGLGLSTVVRHTNQGLKELARRLKEDGLI